MCMPWSECLKPRSEGGKSKKQMDILLCALWQLKRLHPTIPTLNVGFLSEPPDFYQLWESCQRGTIISLPLPFLTSRNQLLFREVARDSMGSSSQQMKNSLSYNFPVNSAAAGCLIRVSGWSQDVRASYLRVLWVSPVRNLWKALMMGCEAAVTLMSNEAGCTAQTLVFTR